MFLKIVFCVATLCALQITCYGNFNRIPRFYHSDFSAHPKANSFADDPHVKRCEEFTRSTTLDHFTWAPLGGFKTFKQRYFICDEFWKNSEHQKGPIFFYIGNEAGVEKYIKSTGLMWETAPEVGALLVFMEHRYYGQSKPYGKNFKSHLQYLSVEQSIADFVEFLYQLQEMLGGLNLPVIGFGGSYGGMLGAWMRMKYPHMLHGMIASSAPIWSFMGEVPPVNPNYFAQIKTYDVTPAAGSSEGCEGNLRKTWDTLTQVSNDTETPGYGPDGLKKALGLCPTEKASTDEDIANVIQWIDNAISVMAEGSYAFPCDYMTEGVADLPPYPLRLGCSHLAEKLEGIELLEGVGKMVEVYYNVTKDKDCLTLKQSLSEEAMEINDLWDYQYCTEMFQIFGSDGVKDMFLPDPWDPKGTSRWCAISYHIQSRPFWVTQQWGGKDISLTSNIVFSNGEYDPWRGGGVDRNISNTVVSIVIKEGGHHADLMFANEHDNESLKAARKYERKMIHKWIKEVRKKNAKLAAEMKKKPPKSPDPEAVYKAEVTEI